MASEDARSDRESLVTAEPLDEDRSDVGGTAPAPVRVRRRSSLLERVSLAAALTSGGLFMLMALMVAVSAVSRYVLQRPIALIEGLSGYVVLFGVFMGLAYTFRTGGHIQTAVVRDRLRPGTRLMRGLDVLGGLVAIVWAATVLVAVYQRTAGYLAAGTTSMTLLQAPLWVPAAMMVLGSALLVVEIVAWIVQLLHSRPAPGPSDEVRE
ncbi:MAG: TRAP transporter small permease subunit [Actinobacteria bacterium]|nr:TRAP transporter small permease subunit [Actinomycetota bacterium]